MSAIAPSTAVHPVRAESSASMAPPRALVPTWVRRSRTRSSGSRVLQAIRSRRSPSISPPRAIRITGRRMPSSKIERDVPEVEPGVLPPTSAWWAMLPQKKRTAPSWWTGVMMEMSGRWLPPAR